MENRILEAEQELEAIRAEMHSPEVVSDGPRLQACYAKLQATEAVVQSLYARGPSWKPRWDSSGLPALILRGERAQKAKLDTPPIRV